MLGSSVSTSAALLMLSAAQGGKICGSGCRQTGVISSAASSRDLWNSQPVSQSSQSWKLPPSSAPPQSIQDHLRKKGLFTIPTLLLESLAPSGAGVPAALPWHAALLKLLVSACSPRTTPKRCSRIFPPLVLCEPGSLPPREKGQDGLNSRTESSFSFSSLLGSLGVAAQNLQRGLLPSFAPDMLSSWSLEKGQGWNACTSSLENPGRSQITRPK